VQINVGSRLKWKGKDVVCISIATTKETCLAEDSSLTMQANLNRLENCKYLHMEIDEFEAGDLISFDYLKLQLSEPGHGIYFIYTHFKVKKETLNGSSGSETSDGKASDASTQASGSGDQSRQGNGSQSAGEDSQALD